MTLTVPCGQAPSPAQQESHNIETPSSGFDKSLFSELLKAWSQEDSGDICELKKQGHRDRNATETEVRQRRGEGGGENFSPLGVPRVPGHRLLGRQRARETEERAPWMRVRAGLGLDPEDRLIKHLPAALALEGGKEKCQLGQVGRVRTAPCGRCSRPRRLRYASGEGIRSGGF